MTDLTFTFDWFEQAPETRESSEAKLVTEKLVELWREVRDEIGAEKFDSVLGTIRAGRFDTGSERAWVQTNDDKDSDFVNLTLEVDAQELTLNVIGWFDPQLEKLESWLRKPKAWRFLRTLPDWSLVVFIRQARVGKSGETMFKGAEGKERERIHLSETSPSNISTRLSGLRPQLEPEREKLALHLRRSWSPAEVAAEGDMSSTIARAVEMWLAPIQEIRLS
jgi:hypothetical protein